MKINPYAKGAASGAYEQGVKTATDYVGVTTQLDAIASLPVTNTVADLKAAIAIGGKVLLKKGVTYLVNEAITLPSNTELDGNFATIKRANASNITLLKMMPNCVVRNLIIDGNKDNQVSPTWDTCRDIVTEENSLIENVVINNGNEGITSSKDNVTIRDCKLTNIAGNGIHFSGSNHVVVDHCSIVNSNLLVGMGHEEGCICWSNMCEDIVCVNNYLENGRSAFGSIDSVDNSNVTLSNNHIENMRVHAFDLVSPSDTAPINIVITGNRIYNSVSVALKNASTTPVSTVEYVVFSNNILIDTLLDLTNVNNITVSGNIIKRSAINLTANTAGISVTRCTNINIIGNIIENYKYGVYPDNSTGLIISNNLLRNIHACGINLQWIVNVTADNNRFINDSSLLAEVSGIIPIIVGKNCMANSNTITMNKCERGIQIVTGGKAFHNRIITASGTPSILIGGGVTGVVAKFNIIDQPITNSAGAGADVADNYTSVA